MPRYRRGAGAVERAGLENRYTRKRIVGSNPTLSAKESAPFPVILRETDKLANIQRLSSRFSATCARGERNCDTNCAISVAFSPLRVLAVHMRKLTKSRINPK